MKYDGSNWVSVGALDFIQDTVEWTSLAFNPLNSEPYIAFNKNGLSKKASVMKFDGVNWTYVGIPDFSAGNTEQQNLIFNPVSNEPILIFQDNGNLGKATVMKYDGINWQLIGSAGFSTGSVSIPKIVYNSFDNTLYAAFNDNGIGGKAHVMKFNGSNWIDVGSSGFSTGSVEYIDITTNNLNGDIFVSYKDNSLSGKATVMKFDGINWSQVGLGGFSIGQIYNCSIRINFNNNPTVSFIDAGNNNHLSVMEFISGSWQYVGGPSVSTAIASISKMEINENLNEIYTAYSDFDVNDKVTVKKTTLSTSILQNDVDKNIAVYPNPNNGIFRIKPENESFYLFEIYDVVGSKKYFSTDKLKNEIIDLSALQDGIYFYKIITKNSLIESGKIIIKK